MGVSVAHGSRGRSEMHVLKQLTDAENMSRLVNPGSVILVKGLLVAVELAI